MKENEKNLEVYNKLKSVPEEAKKQITGGRLKGMTDIKPMWRIEKLTETFGMCGIGWKTSIKNKEIIEGANGEKIAIVDIDLYVKVDGEWSEAIEGTGGSSFIANEKSGPYTSDECFKMAYTDALSVACKSLGMGADVYWGDSKYNTKEEMTEEKAKEYVLGFGKYKGTKLVDLIDEDYDYVDWLFNNESTDEDIIKAIELLTGEVKEKTNDNEKLELIVKLGKLINEKKVDREKLLKYYEVKSDADMTVEQLKGAIKELESRE